MNFAKLLLDPRGAIGRKAFGDGLLALAGIIAVVLVTLGVLALTLSWPVGDMAAAATPLLGTSLLVATIVEAVIDKDPSPMLVPAILLMGARLYVLACLCLKRLRDAGHGPVGLIFVGGASLAFHEQMGRWAYAVWASEMGTLFPPLIDVIFNLLLWTVFLVWLGLKPRRNPSMPALSLLFDPRGVIDRRTFWSGLAQLTLLGLVVWLGLARLGVEGSPAAIPVVGDAFLVGGAASHVQRAVAVDVPLAAAFLIVAARLYATTCLVLKRSRHAGLGRSPLIAFSLILLLIHGLMGVWVYDVFDDGMALITPLVVDMATSALVWAIFLGWIGSRGAWNPLPEAAGFRSAQVKPAS
jgi:uncharacterized membrane protein YhaH (DUF805 family)